MAEASVRSLEWLRKQLEEAVDADHGGYLLAAESLGSLGHVAGGAAGYPAAQVNS